eukprot:9935-Heterococcus_DN1.PRE.2
MDLALCLNVFGCMACASRWHTARKKRRRSKHGTTYPKAGHGLAHNHTVSQYLLRKSAAQRRGLEEGFNAEEDRSDNSDGDIAITNQPHSGDGFLSGRSRDNGSKYTAAAAAAADTDHSDSDESASAPINVNATSSSSASKGGKSRRTTASGVQISFHTDSLGDEQLDTNYIAVALEQLQLFSVLNNIPYDVVACYTAAYSSAACTTLISYDSATTCFDQSRLLHHTAQPLKQVHAQQQQQQALLLVH